MPCRRLWDFNLLSFHDGMTMARKIFGDLCKFSLTHLFALLSNVGFEETNGLEIGAGASTEPVLPLFDAATKAGWRCRLGGFEGEKQRLPRRRRLRTDAAVAGLPAGTTTTCQLPATAAGLPTRTNTYQLPATAARLQPTGTTSKQLPTGTTA